MGQGLLRAQWRQSVASTYWWDNDPGERFWFGINDPKDIGKELWAPQQDRSGKPNWSYSLVRDTRVGDLVFHYSQQDKAIVGASVVASSPAAGTRAWTPRTPRRGAPKKQPLEGPTWTVTLAQFQPLAEPVTLAELRSRSAAIKDIYRDLEARHGPKFRALGPFELGSARRPLRPLPSYLTRLPAAVVAIFPALDAIARGTPAGAPPPHRPRVTSRGGSGVHLGTAYIQQPEDVAVKPTDLWTRDPAVLERAHRGHRKTQNALALALEARGLAPQQPPRSRSSSIPDYDLAWEHAGRWFVVEVKSLSDENEEKQLRLGLGQVLRYQHQLRAMGRDVTALLAVEHAPTDASWTELARAHGVTVCWPDQFDQAIRDLCGA